MANDINVITITGNVGREPELKTMPDGTALLSFSVGNNQYSKGAENDTLTTWYNVSLFGKRAEGLAKFLEKGMGVTVTGSHLMRPYTGKNGDALSCDIRATDVRVDRGSKGEGGEAPRASGNRPASAGRRNVPQVVEDDDSIVPF